MAQGHTLRVQKRTGLHVVEILGKRWLLGFLVQTLSPFFWTVGTAASPLASCLQPCLGSRASHSSSQRGLSNLELDTVFHSS